MPLLLEIHTKVFVVEIIWCLGFILRYSNKKESCGVWGAGGANICTRMEKSWQLLKMSNAHMELYYYSHYVYVFEIFHNKKCFKIVQLPFTQVVS